MKIFSGFVPLLLGSLFPWVSFAHLANPTNPEWFQEHGEEIRQAHIPSNKLLKEKIEQAKGIIKTIEELVQNYQKNDITENLTRETQEKINVQWSALFKLYVLIRDDYGLFKKNAA